MTQLCTNCNPAEDEVYIQASDDKKYIVDSSNPAKLSRELIEKDPNSVNVRYCLLKCLVPDKTGLRTKVEEVIDPLVNSFVTDYFTKSCGNPGLRVTKIEKISNRSV